MEIKLPNGEILSITIDESLNKYKDVVLFPEQLAKANKILSKTKLPNMKKNISFSLTDDETKRYNEWRESLPKYDFGTIGGAYQFIFTPTSLGNIVKVKRDDGYEIDLTDYSSL